MPALIGDGRIENPAVDDADSSSRSVGNRRVAMVIVCYTVATVVICWFFNLS